jgi:hypothetical protein
VTVCTDTVHYQLWNPFLTKIQVIGKMVDFIKLGLSYLSSDKIVNQSLSLFKCLSNDCILLDPLLNVVGQANNLNNLIGDYIKAFKLNVVAHKSSIKPGQMECPVILQNAISLAKEIQNKLGSEFSFKYPDSSNKSKNSNDTQYLEEVTDKSSLTLALKEKYKLNFKAYVREDFFVDCLLKSNKNDDLSSLKEKLYQNNIKTHYIFFKGDNHLVIANVNEKEGILFKFQGSLTLVEIFCI